MGRNPEDSDGQRDHEDDEKETALSSMFAERSPPSRPVFPGGFAETLIVQCNRDVETLAAFVGALQQFFPFPSRNFLRHPGRFLDHPLQILHLLAKILFEPGKFLLLLVQRRFG